MPVVYVRNHSELAHMLRNTFRIVLVVRYLLERRAYAGIFILGFIVVSVVVTSRARQAVTRWGDRMMSRRVAEFQQI